MAKDPAFLFYSSDFLTGVSDLTMEERGQYITLLCLQHQKGHLTQKMITIATANATADVMAKFKKDEDGLFYNERLEVEAEKRAAHSRKQSERATKGWEKRRSHDKATADATALPLEDENENEDINRIKDENGNEKKKSAPKKEKTIFKILQDDWSKRYLDETELKYQWNKAEGATLNQLITKLRNLAKQQHEKDGNTDPVTDDEIVKFWDHFMDKMPEWYSEKADLKIINSKFNAIIAEIKRPYNKGKRMVEDLYREFGIK